MTRLNAESLPTITDVPTPDHDRSRVRTGIVHLGVGGFHRSHEAMYLDRLMEQGSALDRGICGVGVLESDRRMQQVMADQDGLCTLVVKHPHGSLEPRVIGSIVEYRYAPDDPEAVIEKMADEGTRVVSLTVTEGGYTIDQVTGEFDAQDPGVVADLQPGAVPRTVFDLVTEALARRRDRGLPALTIMSCDNIQGNGDREGTPTLDPAPGVDLDEYRSTLIERFANPAVADTLVPLARRQREEPLVFIRNRAVFGDLADDERFVASYRTALDSLHRDGARVTVERLVRPGRPSRRRR
ncbi:hypothetical protein [Pseudonocardia sp. H11422]|uniref:hypothetical protein n=1 Tax=Pseudonocardia sp. H11422 TaxID=2835866 RepID=UPI001BDD5134|nr:hypothetical protein [Pseudonocardia sp. H11422]